MNELFMCIYQYSKGNVTITWEIIAPSLESGELMLKQKDEDFFRVFNKIKRVSITPLKEGAFSRQQTVCVIQ